MESKLEQLVSDVASASQIAEQAVTAANAANEAVERAYGRLHSTRSALREYVDSLVDAKLGDA